MKISIVGRVLLMAFEIFSIALPLVSMHLNLNCYFFQMSMSVQGQTIVVPMQPAWITLDRTAAHVILVTLEMDLLAMVGLQINSKHISISVDTKAEFKWTCVFMSLKFIPETLTIDC